MQVRKGLVQFARSGIFDHEVARAVVAKVSECQKKGKFGGLNDTCMRKVNLDYAYDYKKEQLATLSAFVMPSENPVHPMFLVGAIQPIRIEEFASLKKRQDDLYNINSDSNEVISVPEVGIPKLWIPAGKCHQHKHLLGSMHASLNCSLLELEYEQISQGVYECVASVLLEHGKIYTKGEQIDSVHAIYWRNEKQIDK